MLSKIPSRRPNKLKKNAACTLHPEPTQQEEESELKEPTKRSTHTVVICGATNPGRGLIFGDFMTVCHALMGRGVYGDFISCFPIEDHFAWLQREDFGDGTRVVSATSVYGGCLAYTKEENDSCLKWWHQTGPFEVGWFFCFRNRLCGLSREYADLASQMEARIRQWIAVKAKRAIPGDIINIVVCGHGDPQRLGFYAGYHRIFPFEMDRMLGKFKHGVTVNVISGSAQSAEEDGRTARTKRPRSLSAWFHGLGFSLQVSHSLSLLRLSWSLLQPGVGCKAWKIWVWRWRLISNCKDTPLLSKTYEPTKTRALTFQNPTTLLLKIYKSTKIKARTFLKPTAV